MRFLKVVAFLLLVGVVGPALAEEKFITVKLSQTHFSLNIWDHVKDGANAVTLKLSVSSEFYAKVKVGDSLLDKFRAGSFLVSGSVGNWRMVVISKD